MHSLAVGADAPDVAELVARLERVEAVLRLVEPFLAPDDDGRWLSVSEASRRTGIPVTTLRTACARGRVPAQRVLGRWEISPEWVAAQAIKRGQQS